MKVYVHITVWNKAAHIPWLCEGIKTSLPKGTFVDFVFDNCTDWSHKNFVECQNSAPNVYGSLSGYPSSAHISEKKYRWPNTNDAIERFLKSDYDVFLSPQDDQKLQDRHLYENLLGFYSYPAFINKGILGMRDGVDVVGKYHSSNFSLGTDKTHWLRGGEIQEVDYVNDGPICLTRATIEKVGLFDLDYWAHYADNDYSFRCNEAGLQNYVMGAEVMHEKWGCKICGEIQPSEVWRDEFSKHDYEVYRRKWPNRS